MAAGVLEVEFRCHFDNPEAAYKVLPFLRGCLKKEAAWKGVLYGMDLFKAGKVLRTGRVIDNGKTNDYLTWKGPDTGRFCNIRREIGEEITRGINDSAVMQVLGGKPGLENLEDTVGELARLGYRPFMSWEGTDAHGHYQPGDIQIKLMFCRALKWPWIVEFEKTAADEAGAVQCENDLYEFSREFKLSGHIFKEEPTQLLYEKTFPKG